MILYYYACAIFFTVTCESLPLDRDYAHNVGTVLFSLSDIHKKQWSKSEIGLLQARRYFQNLLPPPIFINTFNEDHVNILLGYFRNAYAAIKKEAKDPETDTIMTTALSDAIGGYLKVWVLPVAKLDYYGGTISQGNVVKLFQFYNEIKRYLDTNGDGWRKPDERILNSMTINVAPLQLMTNTRSMKDPCDHLAYFEKTATGLSIPVPNVNWNDKSSTMFVPLKNVSLILMNTPDTAHNLIKYYGAARSCIQNSNPKEQEKFDEKFQKWLMEDVVPHLKDENLYLALGSVLTLVNRTRDLCNGVLDLYVTKCNARCKPLKPPKINICDISCKKMWIIIIILFIEIAWCVPALLFIICSKKFQKKDCSSNVYLFIDNDKKDKDKAEAKTTCCEDTCSACLENAPDCSQVIRKTVYSNMEFIGQCPSTQKTTTVGTGTVACQKFPPKTCLDVCESIETKTPETCEVSKKSSLKKPSSTTFCDPTQVMSLTSEDHFGSKHSGTSCLTVRSRGYPPVVDIPSRSKKKRDRDVCRRHDDRKRSDDYFKKPNERRRSEDCIKLLERSQAEERRKLRERRQAEEFKKLQERRQAEECRKLEEWRLAAECKKLKERRQAEEYRKLEERRQAEENRKLEERRQAEECRKLEERRQADENRKLEECRKREERRLAEECKKLKERRQAEEYRKLEERRQAEENRKLEERRQAEECRKLEERRLAEENRKLEERRQAEECRKLEERRQAEECRKLEERRQAEESRKLEERRQAEECRKLEEQRQADEYRKLEEQRQADEYRKLEERRQAEECRKLEERRQAEEYRKLEERRQAEEYRKLEERRQADECRKLEERRQAEEARLSEEMRQAEEARNFEERAQAEECRKHEERRQAEEYRKLEERRQAEEFRELEERRILEECRKLRQLDECSISDDSNKFDGLRKLDEPRQHDDLRKFDESMKLQDRKIRDECFKFEDRRKFDVDRNQDETEDDEFEKLEERKKLEERRRRKKAEFCKYLEEKKKYDECRKLEELRKLDECRKLEELWKVDKFRKHEELEFDIHECLDFDESREYEECREFDESRKPNNFQICDGSCLKADDSCIVNEVKYDNFETGGDDAEDDYIDFDEPMCCRQIDTQEHPYPAICPCPGCVKRSSNDSDVTCCPMSLTDMQNPSDKQIDAKTTRFRVQNELKTKGGKGESKFCSQQPYLEITIDRPGTEICVDMSQCRTHSSPYRPSKIPKPAACSIIQASGRQSTCPSPGDKHKSLIPQLKKKTADDLELARCHCTKSIESKLNGSF